MILIQGLGCYYRHYNNLVCRLYSRRELNVDSTKVFRKRDMFTSVQVWTYGGNTITLWIVMMSVGPSLIILVTLLKRTEYTVGKSPDALSV